MIDNVVLENGRYGRRAIITSAWSDDVTGYLADNGIVELELNQGRGWRGKDLAFLAGLRHLQAFKIIDFAISSIEPVHFLGELRALDVMTYCKSEIRFSAFPKLQDCGLEWRPRAHSLFDCSTLKDLFVNRYDGKDVTPFSGLTNLESLAILNAPVENLHGLCKLRKLRSLRLTNLRRLTALAGIEGLASLEELKIDTCRAIGSIQEVGELRSLRILHLNNCGDIKSLKPLDGLKHLECVLFYESTNILDGDLCPLLRQKHLSSVSFMNRKHYSHKREEFGTAYTGVNNG